MHRRHTGVGLDHALEEDHLPGRELDVAERHPVVSHAVEELCQLRHSGPLNHELAKRKSLDLPRAKVPSQMTDRTHDDDDDLGLPDMGEIDGDDLEGVEDDVAVDVRLMDDGGDPFDDSYADDVPLDVEIQTDHHEESAIGDVTLGLDGSLDDSLEEAAGDDGVSIEEGGESMLDEGRGHAEEGLDFGGDDELGIDPIPTEVDDGGVEGLEDPAGEQVDADEFPPLDGNEDDDDEAELELGLDLEPPPPSDEPDEDDFR